MLTEIYRMLTENTCLRLREIELSGNDLSDVSDDLIIGSAELNQSVQFKPEFEW